MHHHCFQIYFYICIPFLSEYDSSIHSIFHIRTKLELANCPESSFFLILHIQSFIMSSYFYLLSLEMISSLFIATASVQALITLCLTTVMTGLGFLWIVFFSLVIFLYGCQSIDSKRQILLVTLWFNIFLWLHITEFKLLDLAYSVLNDLTFACL